MSYNLEKMYKENMISKEDYEFLTDLDLNDIGKYLKRIHIDVEGYGKMSTPLLGGIYEALYNLKEKNCFVLAKFQDNEKYIPCTVQINSSKHNGYVICPYCGKKHYHSINSGVTESGCDDYNSGLRDYFILNVEDNSNGFITQFINDYHKSDFSSYSKKSEKFRHFHNDSHFKFKIVDYKEYMAYCLKKILNYDMSYIDKE